MPKLKSRRTRMLSIHIQKDDDGAVFADVAGDLSLLEITGLVKRHVFVTNPVIDEVNGLIYGCLDLSETTAD